MSGIGFVSILVFAVITAQGSPLKYEEILAAAQKKQWDQVQQLINTDLAKEPEWQPVSFSSVRELKPTNGGHVYGEAEYTFKTATNVDGKTSEDAGGHKVINDDGKVQEFDFQPDTETVAVGHVPGALSAMISQLNTFNPQTFNNVRNLKPPQGGHVYGEAEYSYHSASNINGKQSREAGGHKVINDDGIVKEFDFTPSTDQSFGVLKNLDVPFQWDRDITNLKL